MEEVEDALEVHENQFSQVQLETSVSDSKENFHLIQPLGLDEIDVEVFNEITIAMVITDQDTEPADLPTALAEMPVTEATEHDRLGEKKEEKTTECFIYALIFKYMHVFFKYRRFSWNLIILFSELGYYAE